MSFFSSISAALERIHFPTNTNLKLNSTFGYLDPILQEHNISATNIATVAAVLAASYYVLFNVLEINMPKGYRDIPQLNSWSIIYNTVFNEQPFHKRYEKVIRKALEEHGIARSKQFGRSIVYLGSPEYARQVVLHSESFQKILPTERFPGSFQSHLLGDNIVFSNTSVWRHHRRICNPAFHKSWSTEVFGECATPMLELIASETKNGAKSINMSDMFKRLTLDALGKAAFGFDFKAVENPNGEYVTLFHYIMRNAFNPFYVLAPWLDNIPLFRRNKLHSSVDAFDRIIFKVIEEKRQMLHDANKQGVEIDHKDLLSMMIQANESDEDTLTNEQLRSDVVIFFIAGHDTTANALTCALYHLSRHPEIQEKLYAEISDIIGPVTNSTPVPTIEQTKDMVLLDAVIREGMRMHPSINLLIPREVFSNTPIGPYIIPPGVEIHLNIYGIHHNPKYWDNPDEFRPERFLPDANGNVEKRDPLMWMPFSYGGRSCLGANFSLIEQRVILSMLIHRFKFALPANSPHKDSIKFSPRSALVTTHDLGIEFTPRY